MRPLPSIYSPRSRVLSCASPLTPPLTRSRRRSAESSGTCNGWTGGTTEPDPEPDPEPEPEPEPDPEPEPEQLSVDIAGVPSPAIAGESYELTAQSESDATLVYQWDVRGGTIEPDDAQTVVWTAPETAVVAWIHVDVTHADGGELRGHGSMTGVANAECAPRPATIQTVAGIGPCLTSRPVPRVGGKRRPRPAARRAAGPVQERSSRSYGRSPGRSRSGHEANSRATQPGEGRGAAAVWRNPRRR